MQSSDRGPRDRGEDGAGSRGHPGRRRDVGDLDGSDGGGTGGDGEPPAWRRELQRGFEALERGQGDAARAAFVRAHHLAPDEPAPALALGREEWKRGNFVPAEALLRRALARRPGWPLAVAALARVLNESERRTEAQQLVAAALLDEPHPALLVVEGELLVDADDPEAAHERFLAARAAGAPAVVVDAGLAEVWNARALRLADAGSLDEAVFACKRAGDLSPEWAAPHTNLGTLLYRLGRRGAARQHFEEALRRDPDNATAAFDLGCLLRELGNLPGAAAHFAAAMQARRPHARARRELALIEAQRANYAAALELFEEELAAIPVGTDPTRDVQLFAEVGQCAALAHEDAFAEELLRHALLLAPGHRQARNTLAAVLVRAGRQLEAATLLDEAPAGDGDGNFPGPTTSK